MADSIEVTLREIDAWYNELPGGTKRPSILCKIAILEYCGWLETRMDSLIRMASAECHVDTDWVEKHLIEPTHGFKYAEHFRPMLCAVIGEVFVGKVEKHVELTRAGDLDRLRSSLGELWVTRGSLAHTNTGASLGQQVTLSAPSWTINQQRIIGKVLTNYEAGITAVAAAIAAM